MSKIFEVYCFLTCFVSCL